MIRISNIRVPLEGFARIPDYIAAALGASAGPFDSWRMVRRSVDARRGHRPVLVVTVDVAPRDEDAFLRACEGRSDIEPVRDTPYFLPSPGSEPLDDRVVVVGSGPAGLFCALTLARAGYAPVLLERGSRVPDRVAKVGAFWNGGPLDTECNVQFGEGGAGTFSDGKLTTRIRDPRCALVLKTFVEAGAPPEIEWEHLPHIGTDRLRTVIPAITDAIVAAGGTARFDCRVDDIIMDGAGRVSGVVVNRGAGNAGTDGTGGEFIAAGAVVLATGHSARDTFRMLCSRGVELATKPFAVGLRIEHPQAAIDAAQYGPFAGHPSLPPATYRLAERIDDRRSAWTFCMCPGGSIINSASEAAGTVTNGMSNLARDGRMANSAVVVNVGVEDFGASSPLDGVNFQRRIERAAFEAMTASGGGPVRTSGGGPARASARGLARASDGDLARASDGFPARASGGIPDPGSSMVSGALPRTTVGDIASATYMPGFVLATMARAIPLMGRKIRGFDAPDTPLYGPETRTSSPIRVLRDDTFIATRNDRLYPCGEGAGYAGGIVSAAVDGLHVAEAIIARFTRP